MQSEKWLRHATSAKAATSSPPGQKQLIALARAIIANPQIFVMDEATSSVDTHTECAIQTAVERVLQDRISFVIAHCSRRSSPPTGSGDLGRPDRRRGNASRPARAARPILRAVHQPVHPRLAKTRCCTTRRRWRRREPTIRQAAGWRIGRLRITSSLVGFASSVFHVSRYLGS